MGRMSTKKNKTQYQILREELGLSREKASGISADNEIFLRLKWK